MINKKNLLGAVILMLSLFLSSCQKTDIVEVNNEPPLAIDYEENSPVKELPDPSLKNGVETTTDKIEVVIPSKYELKVLFSQQAPFANWDELHQEACEEASIIMAVKYFNNEPLDETIMEQEIQKLVKWQEENGYQVDLTAKETVQVLKNYFNIEAEISFEVTSDKIKYEIVKGNLVIVPAAGRKLGNPNFKQPGPIYHMLLIKGFNGSEFITNDPGTRKGNGYKYKYEKLIGAIHDWNHELASEGMTDEEIEEGQKVIIIVKGSVS